MIETLADVRARCNVDDRTGCWHWTGSCKAKYHTPLFHKSGQRTKLQGRRVVWEMVNGPVPEGRYLGVRRWCEPDCLNPEHLRILTRSQYMRKAPSVRKKSAVTVARMTIASRKRADLKLDLEKAREIRTRIGLGERPAHVAKAMGVSRSTVNLVKFNRLWREPTPWGII